MSESSASQNQKFLKQGASAEAVKPNHVTAKQCTTLFSIQNFNRY